MDQACIVPSSTLLFIHMKDPATPWPTYIEGCREHVSPLQMDNSGRWKSMTYNEHGHIVF